MLQGPMEKGLPPGFRFHPTDEELVLQYLKRKAFSCPLPAAIIPEIDFAKLNPRDLPGGGKRASYFFHRRMAKYQKGSRSNRATASGYWKATGRDTHIIASKSGYVVGMKKFLVFYQGRPPAAFRTDWVMHEYRLAHSTGQHSGDWVLCRVFTKKRAAEMDTEAEGVSAEEQRGDRRSRRLFRDASPSCSLNLSCVTELSDGSGDGKASGCSSFSSPPP